MSGICGIVRFGGARVDRALVRAMTAALAFRGPDRQDTRIEGGVGFGHALLRCTPECAWDAQPERLEHAWITADARIDARDELVRELRGRGRAGLEECSDAALILHAYLTWGEDCVRHLLGDFAFAIWDARARRLFCAIDHFGVKALFYSAFKGGLVFGNTLDAVRMHPAVGTALDDLAIADFLLFEINQDPASTAFADIRRLPAGSCMTVSADGLRVESYWQVPRAEVRYRRAGDYVEHFRELFARAVEDRLRTHRVAVSMSGGLDSTSIAATAKTLLAGQARPFVLQAHTGVYDRLIPDEERRYAGLVAGALGIPVTYHPGDDCAIYEGFGETAAHFPDPYHGPDEAIGFRIVRAAARDARVLLTGFDADTLLNESPRPYLRALWNERRFGLLGSAAAGYLRQERRTLLRALLRRCRPAPRATSHYPPWLEPRFEARLALRERWEDAYAGWMKGEGVRPAAHQYLVDFQRYGFFFDQYDAGVTRMPLEVRHPFFDARVVAYCLSLPPVPWCVKKRILREAMGGALPRVVLQRRKAPLAGWPAIGVLARPESRWVDGFTAAAGLEGYVIRSRVPSVTGGGDPMEAWMNLRPLTLSLWLEGMRSFENSSRSMQHEIA